MAQKELLCTNCGTVAKPKRITKGSLLIEIVLWLMVIIPGLIYSIWRQVSKYTACPNCKAPKMIPLDSPMAQKFLNA